MAIYDFMKDLCDLDGDGKMNFVEDAYAAELLEDLMDDGTGDEE